ncbi:hypothetical protein DMA10_06620 [Streptomyces sp. WAC 01420]|nr:hypothetical protein DLM49_11615 [Streptomyces sp. WAC 01438]RSM99881.1 hypothetical protein DMA10_06620 [Streptomyces sp. WAC 01420]
MTRPVADWWSATAGSGLAGRGVLLVETVRKAGLDTAISAAVAPWLKARAVHHPGRAASACSRVAHITTASSA